MTLNPFFEQFIVFYFRVSDLQRALAFYEGKLGFKPVYVSEGRWAELSFGLHQRPHLGLNRYTGEGPLPTNAGGIPSFEVQDMESLKTEVERQGIPHEAFAKSEGLAGYCDGFQFLWIFDPDGNKIEFVKLVQDRLS
ncbi:MAG: VOC family protein [Anaerolineae bacterium]